jgi:L-ribulokinase
VASGLYSTIKEAQEAMGSGFDAEYFPEKEKVEIFKKLYNKYLEFGQFVEFGK